MSKDGIPAEFHVLASKIGIQLQPAKGINKVNIMEFIKGKDEAFIGQLRQAVASNGGLLMVQEGDQYFVTKASSADSANKPWWKFW